MHRWQVNVFGEKCSDDWEIAVVREDSEHGLSSYGWFGKDKLLVGSSGILNNDRVCDVVWDGLMDLAEDLSAMLNEGYVVHEDPETGKLAIVWNEDLPDTYPGAGDLLDGLTREQRQRCIASGDADLIIEAHALAVHVYSGMKTVTVALGDNPDGGNVQYVLRVTVSSSVEEVCEQNHRYTEAWVSAMPYPEVRKVVVCVDIVGD